MAKKLTHNELTKENEGLVLTIRRMHAKEQELERQLSNSRRDRAEAYAGLRKANAKLGKISKLIKDR